MALVSSVFVLALMGEPSAPSSAGWTRDPRTRVEDWRADMDALAKEPPARHKNAFFRCTRSEFEAAARALRDSVPRLADHQAVAGLMGLAAMLGDAHTGIAVRELSPPWHQFPVTLYVFSDGVFVTGAGAGHEDLTGCTLLSFGATPTEEALRRVAATSAYENEAAFLDKAPRLLPVAEIAHAVGLSPAIDRVTLTVRDRRGTVRTVELEALPAGARVTPATAPEDSLPLYRRTGPGRNWFRVLPGSRALYFRYGACADEPQRKVADLGAEMLRAIDAGEAARVIVDLRENGGGNSALLQPFIAGLKARPALRGRVAALIGRRTFSSAEMNAAALKAEAGAVLIGEPTGQKPNAYGEVKSFTLPRSGLVVYYSTKYWKTEEGDRPSLEPDHAVRLSSADYFGLQDPVLAAALERTAGKGEAGP